VLAAERLGPAAPGRLHRRTAQAGRLRAADRADVWACASTLRLAGRLIAGDKDFELLIAGPSTCVRGYYHMRPRTVIRQLP
jgi:hypothetical protein